MSAVHRNIILVKNWNYSATQTAEYSALANYSATQMADYSALAIVDIS